MAYDLPNIGTGKVVGPITNFAATEGTRPKSMLMSEFASVSPSVTGSVPSASVMMATAGPQARFLHCLPAHRGEEVSAEVIDGPQSVVWRQAENRMHAVRALFALLARPSSEEATRT